MYSKSIPSLFAALLLSTLNYQSSTFGQGTAFTYQGFLTDVGGPANGLYDLEFRVFDMASGGSQQGSTVTVDDQGITNGLFTVLLDPGAGVFTGPDRWLDLAVRPGASTDTYTNVVPRQPITPAPYAIRAAGLIGPVPDSQLSSNVALLNGNQTFTDAVRFSPSSGGPPFQVSSSDIVTNFNADLFDGLDAASFLRTDVFQAIRNDVLFDNAPGDAPFQVSSSDVVTNLNADLFDGQHATSFVAKGGDTMTGSLGIGTSPAYQLQLSTDSAGKPNGGSWANSSDARVKKDIQPLSGALNRLAQLRGVSFEWINPADHANQTGRQLGFVAQEVERTFPHWITLVAAAEHDRALTDDGKIKSLTLPFEFDALVVEAIKGLNAKVESGLRKAEGEKRKVENNMQRLEAENAELKQENGRLAERLTALEKLVNRLTVA
jgi:hypothetical protein